MLRYSIALCLAFFVAFSLVYCEEKAKQPALLLRCPSLSPDGSKVAFEYEGDIMTAPILGGEAVRLTIDMAHESNPVFSPDGEWIAYSANYSGFSNIYVIPYKGGAPRRLTWFNAEETPTAWSPDGMYIYFNSHRDRAMTVYRVPFSGGTPAKLVDIPNDPVYGASSSPDGSKLLINYRASVEDMVRRGNYNPGAAEIYLADNAVPASNFVRITNNDRHEFFPSWSPDGSVFYYISDADGSWNLYRKEIAKDAPKQLTHFRDRGIGKYAIAAKASVIVAERNHRLCRIDINNGNAEPIDIIVSHMPKFETPDFAIEETAVTDYVISPDGRKVVFVHKHDLFIMSATGGYVKQLTRTAVRECHPSWSPDSQHILFNRVTYAGKDIVKIDIADGSETALTSGGGNFCTPLYSPDGKFIAYHYNFEEIRAIDPDGGNTRTLVSGTLPRRYLLDERWFNFTSDDKFLCYLAFNDIMRQECIVKRLDEDSPPILMSYIGGHSYAGAFSKDYSFYVYANPWFDKPKIYLVDLVGFEPPLPPDTKDALDKMLNPPDPNDKKDADKADGKQPDAQKPPIELPALTDIAKKTHLAAPSVEGSQDCPVLLPDGKTLLFVGGAEGDTIYTVVLKPNSKDAKPIKTIAGAKTKLKCDDRGAFAYFICAGNLYRTDLASGTTSKITPDKITRTISADALRRAILDEYLWHLRSAFYDPAMHGVDLDILRARYIPLIATCTTDEQFEWLMDEVSGEFNASHMGFFREKKGKDRPVVAEIPHLGFLHDDAAIERGELKVRHIVKGSPAARKSSGLKTGDKVIAVNGKEITVNTDIHSLLWLNTELIELTVVSDKADGNRQTVRYARTSVADMIQLCNEEWIDDNRRLVETKSGGTLGYIFIQNMMQPDYDHLKSELERIASTTKGAVLDFRYNGGGFVAFKVVELLKQQHFAFTSMRGGKEVSEDILRDFVYPHPVAGLFNFGSFSNAEMMLCAFSTAELGVTIGTPTAGGVIGTWGRQLPDGTWMRLPQYKVVDANDRNLERSPTRPQIVLDRDLSDMAKGIDPQIERAISELLNHSKKKGDK